jgi:hypothetical protein
MLVGVGRELPKQAEPGVDHPLALIGDSRIEFRGVGRPEPSGDVLVWRGRYPAPKATVADEWPDDEQITYLVRLGPKVIVVETNKDWPMEVKTGNATVPLAAWR